jgi:hypothetical protein
MVVPVLVEELKVQKRLVATGKVRMTKVVHERETRADEPLWHNDTTILSVVEEVLVVKKRWMLREERPIRTQRLEMHQPNGSRYAAKTYRVSVYRRLMNIHEGAVVWQRHW